MKKMFFERVSDDQVGDISSCLQSSRELQEKARSNWSSRPFSWVAGRTKSGTEIFRYWREISEKEWEELNGVCASTSFVLGEELNGAVYNFLPAGMCEKCPFPKWLTRASIDGGGVK